MKVDGVHSQIRYNLHKNTETNSMIGIKCEAKQLLDYKINHHELKAEFPPEKKEDKKAPKKEKM